jgi:hypothetical protein
MTTAKQLPTRESTPTGRYLKAQRMVLIQIDALRDDVRRTFPWDPQAVGYSEAYTAKLGASLERLEAQIAEMRMKLMAFENSQHDGGKQ